MEIIKSKILNILKSNQNVDQTKTIAVSLAVGNTTIGNKSEGSFGSNGINLQIYAMVNKVFFTDFLEVQDKILLDIAKEFNALAISFAVNPATVKIESSEQNK